MKFSSLQVICKRNKYFFWLRVLYCSFVPFIEFIGVCSLFEGDPENVLNPRIEFLRIEIYIHHIGHLTVYIHLEWCNFVYMFPMKFNIM